jgi:hypothetical protein
MSTQNAGPCSLCISFLGLLNYRDIAVGIFPECEEILVSTLHLLFIARSYSSKLAQNRAVMSIPKRPLL